MAIRENSKVYIKGSSMRPLMRDGDVPEIHPVSRDTLIPGDIIVFLNQYNKYIIHRIVETSPKLVTRGDNCPRNDPPVPENSPLWFVSGFSRDGKFHPVKSGAAGIRQFRRHQHRRSILCAIRRIAGGVLTCNPFRYPFSKLQKTQFKDQTVYYFGSKPVGYFQNGQWRWIMRLASFWIEKPPAQK